jgi:hypothetical protein
MMSMEGRYVTTVGVITVFRNANSLAFRRYHAFASGASRKPVATISAGCAVQCRNWPDKSAKAL